MKRKTALKNNFLLNSPIVTILYILGLMTIVAVLSLNIFSTLSLRLDESQSIWQSSHSVTGILYVIALDVHVPLYHIILHYWMLIFGNTVSSVRLLSLIFFLLVIPATYLLAKATFNKKIALFSVLLVSISPFMNWYGNETRMYTLLALVTIMSQFFFIKILKENKLKYWLGYALTALIGIYSHYFFILVLLTQVIFFLTNFSKFHKKSIFKFLAIAILTITAFAPWIIYVLKEGSASGSRPHLVKPSSVDLFNIFSQFLFGFQTDVINTVLVSLWPISIILIFFAINKSKKIPDTIIYFFLASILPIAFALLISLTVTPIFVSRYLIVCLPSIFIFIAWFLSLYPLKLQFITKSLLVILIVVTFVLQFTNVETPTKENYKEVSSFLISNAKPSDIIIISAPFTIYPLEYYYDGNTALTTLPIWDRVSQAPNIDFSNPTDLSDQVNTVTKNHTHAWVLLSYNQGYETRIKSYFDNHFTRLYDHNFSNKMNLYEYQIYYP